MLEIQGFVPVSRSSPRVIYRVFLFSLLAVRFFSVTALVVGILTFVLQHSGVQWDLPPYQSLISPLKIIQSLRFYYWRSEHFHLPFSCSKLEFFILVINYVAHDEISYDIWHVCMEWKYMNEMQCIHPADFSAPCSLRRISILKYDYNHTT